MKNIANKEIAHLSPEDEKRVRAGIPKQNLMKMYNASAGAIGKIMLK